MAQRDTYILSLNGNLRRDTAAGPRSPFASALKSLSEPKLGAPKPAPQARITPPARSA